MTSRLPTTWIGSNPPGTSRAISVDYADLLFLLSGEGQRLLAQVSSGPIGPDDHLVLAEELRRRTTPGRAGAVLETCLLRQKAAAKFQRAGSMYFTRDGLEQATAETVAGYRAARYAAAGYASIADLGCGIGGDAIALAASADVVAVDRDYLKLAMMVENGRAYSVADRISPVLASLEQLNPLAVDTFFFDPARRTPAGPRAPAARRLHSVRDYLPPLEMIDAWRKLVSHGAVKVSPAIDYEEIPAAAEVEFVSLDGEVKEGLLWYGDLRKGDSRAAVLLPAGHRLVASRVPAEAVPARPPGTTLYEPDGAVIRAHLVAELAHELAAWQIDPSIAYLSSDWIITTPWAKAFAIEDWFPFQLKRLRGYLRERGVGHVVIKKRGSPLDPDQLRHALRLSGNQSRHLFLTQVKGKAAVIIGQPLDLRELNQGAV